MISTKKLVLVILIGMTSVYSVDLLCIKAYDSTIGLLINGD